MGAWRAILTVILPALAIVAAEPCGSCHIALAAAHAKTRHANALKPYDGQGFAGKTLRERGGTAFSYRNPGLSIVRDGARRAAAIQWLFGAARYARTPVFQFEGQWVEHRISQYPDAGRLGLTPGQVRKPSDSFAMAFGRKLTDAGARQCFGCHSTSPQRPGIHCERCHGDGAGGTFQPAGGLDLCVECHQSPNRTYTSPTPELEDPVSIRYAPVGLSASKCFEASEGKLTCVTCHDPHTDAKTVGRYDKECLSCHQPGAKVNCPRSSNCVSCHMPKSRPFPYATYTDHRIR